MTQEEKRMIDFILEMPRFDFQTKVLRGIAKDRAFGALVSFGANNLNETERKQIGEALSKIDPVFTENLSDEILNRIAITVANRSVKLL